MRTPDLRPARLDDDDDRAWLRRLHDASRSDLTSTGLPPDALGDMLALQHTAQEQVWESVYPGLERFLVTADGRVVGRLYLHHADEEVRIVDLVIAVDDRGGGLGSAVLRTVIERDGTRPVLLHVRPDSGARPLYSRLGFVDVGASDTHVAMRRDPGVRPDDAG